MDSQPRHTINSRLSTIRIPQNFNSWIRNSASAPWRILQKPIEQYNGNNAEGQRCLMSVPVMTGQGIKYQQCTAAPAGWPSQVEHLINRHIDIFYKPTFGNIKTIQKLAQFMPSLWYNIHGSRRRNQLEPDDRAWYGDPVARCRGCSFTMTMTSTFSDFVVSLVNEPLMEGYPKEVIVQLNGEAKAMLDRRQDGGHKEPGFRQFFNHCCSDYNQPLPNGTIKSSQFFEALYCLECKTQHITTADLLAHQCYLNRLTKKEFMKTLRVYMGDPPRQLPHPSGKLRYIPNDFLQLQA